MKDNIHATIRVVSEFSRLFVVIQMFLFEAIYGIKLDNYNKIYLYIVLMIRKNI